MYIFKKCIDAQKVIKLEKIIMCSSFEQNNVSHSGLRKWGKNDLIKRLLYLWSITLFYGSFELIYPEHQLLFSSENIIKIVTMITSVRHFMFHGTDLYALLSFFVVGVLW